jgi:Mitochondrial ribosomal subunit protein
MVQGRVLASPLNRILSSLTLSETGLFNASRRTSISFPRPFSSDDGKLIEEQEAATGQAPVAAAAAAAAAAEETPASNSTKEEEAAPTTNSGPSQADLIAKGYSKRQAAWISPDPEKQKHFLPRLSRKERGSYATDLAASQFANELEMYPKVPEVPLYNLREVVPEMVQPRSLKFEALKAARANNPRASLVDIAAIAGISIPPPRAPPAPGAEPILEWDVKLILVAGAAGEAHPMNKKAKCKVHLRALQRQFGLSDAALEHIAEIAGPRYNEKTGEMTLTSEKYQERELNRQYITQMLTALVEEGKKVDRGNNGKKANVAGKR